jgi:hypothetical protein
MGGDKFGQNRFGFGRGRARSILLVSFEDDHGRDGILQWTAGRPRRRNWARNITASHCWPDQPNGRLEEIMTRAEAEKLCKPKRQGNTQMPLALSLAIFQKSHSQATLTLHHERDMDM